MPHVRNPKKCNTDKMVGESRRPEKGGGGGGPQGGVWIEAQSCSSLHSSPPELLPLALLPAAASLDVLLDALLRGRPAFFFLIPNPSNNPEAPGGALLGMRGPPLGKPSESSPRRRAASCARSR